MSTSSSTSSKTMSPNSLSGELQELRFLLEPRVVEIRYDDDLEVWYSCEESTDPIFNRKLDKLLIRSADTSLLVRTCYTLFGEERMQVFACRSSFVLGPTVPYNRDKMYNRAAYFSYDQDTLYLGPDNRRDIHGALLELAKVLDLGKIKRLYYDYHSAKSEIAQEDDFDALRTDWDLLDYFPGLQYFGIVVDHRSWEVDTTAKMLGTVSLIDFPDDMVDESRLKDWAENAEIMYKLLKERWGDKAPRFMKFGLAERGGESTRGSDH